MLVVTVNLHFAWRTRVSILQFLTDYDGVRLCLRTAATNVPIVHPPGDM
jgi:hypothetical protein